MRKSISQPKLTLDTLFWDKPRTHQFFDPLPTGKSEKQLELIRCHVKFEKWEIHCISISANFAANKLKIDMQQN